MKHKTAENALIAVSYLFLIIGAIALLETVVRAVRGTFHFNFGMLGILGIAIFVGLRRHSALWRNLALLFTWYGIVTLCIAMIVCLYGEPPSSNVIVFGQGFSMVPSDWLSIPLAMILLVTLWQYRILTHPAIRRLFQQEDANTHDAVPNVG